MKKIKSFQVLINKKIFIQHLIIYFSKKNVIVDSVNNVPKIFYHILKCFQMMIIYLLSVLKAGLYGKNKKENMYIFMVNDHISKGKLQV
jgi:hypothetical protein